MNIQNMNANYNLLAEQNAYLSKELGVSYPVNQKGFTVQVTVTIQSKNVVTESRMVSNPQIVDPKFDEILQSVKVGDLILVTVNQQKR